ncbi:MAG: protein kinase [Polyangia bacterium]|jgi:serine/threonine-protein kinase|nr:protein kinase [Polyangia bacterium]
MLGKILGKYEILAELGSGGMATVYRARDRDLGREVAIKLMHPHLAKRPEYAERFRREARAVAALRHPHIIEIHDFLTLESEGGEGPPITFMVSELVEGPALSQTIEEHPRMFPEVAALCGARIAEALACAHGAGIIHRDVKPENILIARGGRPILTDFGIARVLEGETVTATGALIGSPSYMSPEQARGLRPVAASDIFSLGVVLYRAATGRLPFPGKDPLTVITAILKGDFRPAVQVAPLVGNRFDAILRRCLAPEASERFESASELAGALLDFAAEGGLTDADGELRRYFAAPEAFEASTAPRVVETLMDRAERKASSGALAAALGLCDRALCLAPENPRAAQMLSDLAKRSRGKRWLWGLGAGVAVMAGALAVIWTLGGRESGTVEVPPGLAALPPVQPDAAPESLDAGLGDARAGHGASRDGGFGSAKGLADASPEGPRVGGRRRIAEPEGRRPPAPDAAVEPRRRHDAGAPVAPRVSPDASTPRVAPALPGSLQVMVLPFCDVQVDGRAFGSSPMPSAKALLPGKHEVRCLHGPSGSVYSKVVEIEPGRLLSLRGSVLGEAQVTIRLTRGDQLQIGTVSYGPGQRSLTPGSFRFRLLKGGGEVQKGWVTIPPGRCILEDSPVVRCR